jgi:hypothetical protein
VKHRDAHRRGLTIFDSLGVKREIAKLIQALKDWVPGREIREPMMALGERKARLKAELRTLPIPNRSCIRGWPTCTGRKSQISGRRSRRRATDRKRPRPFEDCWTRLSWRPTEGQLRIVAQGNLEAMLTIAQNAKRPSDVDDLQLAANLVAGARNQRYLSLLATERMLPPDEVYAL